MYKNVTFAQGLAVLVPKQQLLLVSFKLIVCNAVQARQHLKKILIDKNFEKPKVTTNYCDEILNFKPDMMLKVKFGSIYSIWYSNT